MQGWKLCEQQGIKLVMKQTSTDARIATLEAKLGINSQLEESDAKKKEGETPKEPAWERNRGNPAVTHQASGANERNLADSQGHQERKPT